VYGAGNVEVSEAREPSAENGLEPYEITFIGGLAGVALARVLVSSGGFFKLVGGKEEVKAQGVSKGASDGQVVVAENNGDSLGRTRIVGIRGDGNASRVKSPVKISDVLPAGCYRRVVGFGDW
jgi:hypothetical protein